MNRVQKLLIAVVPLVMVVGCSTTGTSQTDSNAADKQASAAVDKSTAAVATPVTSSQGFSGHVLDDPNSLLSERVIYFAYDRSEIDSKSRDILAAHAQYMKSHSSARITLEGHADERGSREYNMGLGERRATGVRKLLMLQGASARQADVTSFGEERPTAFAHDEASWQLNRRVEILYKRR